ncbi:hypothetical protein PS15m_011266 [Mucor circinelloides]
MLLNSTAFSHCWKRFLSSSTNTFTAMPLVRRESSSSTSSTSSSCSSKSVSFGDHATVFYTHNSSDYDRSAMREPHQMSASLGRIFLTEPEQAIIGNPQQDRIVERNTFANARRGIEGYAIIRQIRSQ